MAGVGITWAFGEVTSLDTAFNTTSAVPGKLKDLKGNEIEVVYRGEIQVKLSSSTSGAPPGTAGKTVAAYPSNINSTRVPLVGEHIILFQGPGNQLGPAGPEPKTGEVATGNAFDLEWYYLDALALQGSVHLNSNPGANVGAITGDTPVTVVDGAKTTKAESYEATAQGNPVTNAPATKAKTKPDQNTIDSLPGLDFKEKDDINNLQPFEGDTIYQGRYGQSLRFGSSTSLSDESKTAKRYQKQPTWKPGSSGDQGPIVILRAGPDPNERNSKNDYIIEQINGDKASIWVCAGQQVPMELASNKFDALNETHQNAGDSMTNPSGTSINSTHCNASGAPCVPPEAYGPDNPIPSGVAELEEVPGEWPMYDTSRGTPQAMGKLRIIQGIPFFEHMCDAVLNLIKAASADGHRIGINSGYRGVKDVVVNGRKYATGQLTLRRQNARDSSWKTDAMWNNDKSKLWKASSGNFSPATASPGRSKHQNGIAIDMSTSSRTSKTGMYHWLCWNAYKYGFIRTVSSEEWHFEYKPGAKTFDRCPANQSKWHGQGDGHPHA